MPRSLCLLALAVVGACAPAADDDLVVFAAASLTEAFAELESVYEQRRPDVDVLLNLAGSQLLAAQIVEGAPADVFASADAAQMERVTAAGVAAFPSATFATNGLAIAVEPGNPLGVGALEDLAEPGVVVVLPAEEVPAGRYARQALDRAGVDLQPASLEHDVRAALAKVALGEADAAIVYSSDIVAADGRVDGIPLDVPVDASYLIAPLDPAGQAFVDLVLGSTGRRLLGDHGFIPP